MLEHNFDLIVTVSVQCVTIYLNKFNTKKRECNNRKPNCEKVKILTTLLLL